MMSKAADAPAAGGGGCRIGAHSNCGDPASAACRGWSSFSKLGLRLSPPDYHGDEYQRWRNPAYSESYFDSITKSGEGRLTVWQLTHVSNDTCGRCGGQTTLKFELAVAANGTITELLFNGAPLMPLQWRRHVSKTDDTSVSAM